MSAGAMSILKRGYTAAKTITGNFVTDAVFEERQATCRTCSDLIVVNDIHFCRKCKCPFIAAFAIRWKNTKADWECPNGLHKE